MRISILSLLSLFKLQVCSFGREKVPMLDGCAAAACRDAEYSAWFRGRRAAPMTGLRGRVCHVSLEGA